jgi:hypothetical protein
MAFQPMETGFVTQHILTPDVEFFLDHCFPLWGGGKKKVVNPVIKPLSFGFRSRNQVLKVSTF